MRNQHSQPILRQTSSRGRSAFTLVELILSVTIMGILMTGLASAIVIVTYAVPSGDSLAITIVDAAEVSDQIVEELRPAIWITEHTGTSVAFNGRRPRRRLCAGADSLRMVGRAGRSAHAGIQRWRRDRGARGCN